MLPQTIALFAMAGGALVHSESASWSGAAASGWVRAAFSSPPALTAATGYKSMRPPEHRRQLVRRDGIQLLEAGAGSGGITNGPLSAPNNAGASPGQASYQPGRHADLSRYSTFNSSNYWVDPGSDVRARDGSCLYRSHEQHVI